MKIQYVQGKPLFTTINKNKKQYPYLTDDIETDICIIGGGVTGAIASYYFSKQNIKTVILEKKKKKEKKNSTFKHKCNYISFTI